MRKRRREDNIDRLYNSFVVKDLSRREFRKEYLRLTCQTGINADLAGMVMDRQAVRTVNVIAKEKKQEIDDAVREM